jgi:hypothetical protein
MPRLSIMASTEGTHRLLRSHKRAWETLLRRIVLNDVEARDQQIEEHARENR